MAWLSLAYEQCVRTRAAAASCEACVAACPTRAVALDDARRAVTVVLEQCVDCGLCQAACPTEALRTSFDVASYVSAPAPEAPVLTCGGRLPCLAALAAEDLAVLALRRGGVALCLDDCAGCALAHAALPAIAAHAEQARALLVALGAEADVRSTHAPSPGARTTAGDRPASPSRRGFLRGLLPTGMFQRSSAPAEDARVRARIAFDAAALDVQRLRARPLTERRQRLVGALRDAGLTGPAAPLTAAQVGFCSQKELDARSCTACMLCVNVCPTGALSSSKRHDELRFAASACVKCGLCHDVCEPDALGLAPTFDVAALADDRPRALARLPIARCGDCGATFKSEHGEPLCPRCRDLEAEARELAGVD